MLLRSARSPRFSLENKIENSMTMRIAILAACAGTLALAQADVAQANYSAASESKTLVRIADVGSEPVIVVAQSAPVNTTRSNKKAGVAIGEPIPGIDIVVRPGGGMVRQQPNAGSGRGTKVQRQKAGDNASPLPRGRKVLPRNQQQGTKAGEANDALVGVSTTRGRKIGDNTSPFPRDRKVQRQEAGPGTTKPAIFDRWGNSKK